MTRTNGTRAAWLDAYHGLRAEIFSGDLEPGTDLPTLAELAKRMNLTTHGARRVMERLRADGHVQSWQGKGYRVVLPKLTFSITEKTPTFGAQVRSMGYDCTSRMVSSTVVGASQTVARRMQLRAGTKVLRTETLRKVNGRPYALSKDFFPADRFRGLDTSIAETGSVLAALEIYGVDRYERDRTTFEARLPTAHEALLLEVPRHQPVYETMGANVDPAGQVLQVSKGVWRADCVSYEV